MTTELISTDGLAAMHGRINDADSHEMSPTHLWGDIYGPVGKAIAAQVDGVFPDLGDDCIVRPDVEGDLMEITHDVVWNKKGCGAPSAIEMRRRPEVMDAQGINRQLVFPGFGLMGSALLFASEQHAAFAGGLKEDHPADLETLGMDILRAHNDWVIRGSLIAPNRVRPVAIVPTRTLDEAMAEGERVVAGGCRAVMITPTIPPAGKSPGHAQFDPFWRLMEQTRTAVLIHIGNEFLFLPRAREWLDHPVFANDNHSLDNPGLNAYTMSIVHLAAENFLAAAVLGGVFERHPELRFGVIELGAGWVGPLAERMDMHAPAFEGTRPLPMKPSEYVARNVRVTPFAKDPIDRYFDRYPDLADVFVFSTDYPHVEGGRNSAERFFDRLLPLGDPSLMEKFFVTNGEWLLPD